MIGVRKNIIIVNIGFADLIMINPVLLSGDTPYETEEGCLSLEGVRKAIRFKNIEAEYLDDKAVKQARDYCELIGAENSAEWIWIQIIWLLTGTASWRKCQRNG